MINVLFSAKPERWGFYKDALKSSFQKAGLDVDLRCEFEDPASVDYLVFAPNGPVSDFTPFTGAKAVLNLWAGVENLTRNPTLNIPLARMVDTGLTEGMREYVCGHVLRHHLGMDTYIQAKPLDWKQSVPPLARNRTVGILGLGALGQDCARSLAALNFNVLGWSRRPKDIDGITSFSGDAGLKALLSEAEILVLLLPHTPQTEKIVNAEALALLPKGAVIINPGRGALIDDNALLSALSNGQVAHATLDVFWLEPLPSDHPYWAHPNVTITPHIASETRADTASEIIADNIKRGEAGQEFLFLVDRTAGY
ncbi:MULTISPECIES: 2-hydroxyacid dehydrogenase [Falsihalocynthiibacter]|uniref:2-hydroxyacid dehydrogenase n=1 Tax=Falsihalocynthiibacter TaxID=2854182 RepID=UPI00300336DC